MYFKGFILTVISLLLISCHQTQVYIEEVTFTYELVTDEDIIMQMVEYLEEAGCKGSIKSEIRVEKILNELPNDCYMVSLDYALVKNIVVTKDSEIISSLAGGTSNIIYKLDSNGDGKEELLFISDIGSGLRLLQFVHYDFDNHKIASGTFYNNNDGISFKVNKNKIYAHHYYYEFDRMSEEPIGKIKFSNPIEIDNLN